jgi:tetratricopeptide (TPR) repeat protein
MRRLPLRPAARGLALTLLGAACALGAARCAAPPARGPYATQGAASRDPATAQALTARAAALIASQPAEAEKLLTELATALAISKQNKVLARVQRQLGNIAVAQGQSASALQRFEAAYQLDPTHPAVVASLGRLALKQNDAEKARRYFRALLLQSFDEKAAGITKAEVYLALGRLHLEAKEVPKARNLFERGLESDPKNQDLKDALAALPRG